MIPSTVFYHRTRREAAAEIMRSGFRDATGSYLTRNEYTGVWLSDRPLTGIDCVSVTDDDVILRLTLPCAPDDLAEYEWVYEMIPDPDTGEPCSPSSYREWLVPAERINGAAVVEMLEEDDVE